MNQLFTPPPILKFRETVRVPFKHSYGFLPNVIISTEKKKADQSFPYIQVHYGYLKGGYWHTDLDNFYLDIFTEKGAKYNRSDFKLHYTVYDIKMNVLETDEILLENTT